MTPLAKVLPKLTEEQWSDLTDGHGLYKTEHYVKMGFPDEFVKQFIQEFESVIGNPKATIFHDGKVIEKCIGIYNLDFVEGVARTLKVDYESKIGRGFQARSIVTALKQKYKRSESK